jgi:hypothetical protein
LTNGKSRVGEFKLACKKHACTGTELALLTRSVQLKQTLLELVPAAGRQMLDARAAILHIPAETPAVVTKKRNREMKNKQKAKRPSSDSDSESDDESRSPTWERSFCTKMWARRGTCAGINTDPNVMVTFGDVFHVLWRAAEAFAVNKGLTIVDLDGGKTGEEMTSDRQHPGGVNGKFCGAEVLQLQRSGFLRSEFDVYKLSQHTRRLLLLHAPTREWSKKPVLWQSWSAPNKHIRAWRSRQHHAASRKYKSAKKNCMTKQ